MSALDIRDRGRMTLDELLALNADDVLATYEQHACFYREMQDVARFDARPDMYFPPSERTHWRNIRITVREGSE